YANGGSFRKWYGHHDDVVLWQDDGHVLRTERHHTGRIRATNLNLDVIFSPGITWSAISSTYFGTRLLPEGFLFSSVSSSLFTDRKRLMPMLAFLNSKVTPAMVTLLNPTMHINPGDVAKLPFPQDQELLARAGAIAEECYQIAKDDWDSSETSWDFVAN